MPSTTLPAVGAASGATTSTASATIAKGGNKGKARAKPAILREARTGSEAQPPAPRATVESRLGAWDPDSPVPP
jgi:hypothetical protein